VLLTAYGNVPPQRAAQVIGMLLGAPVSAGWVDKASARLPAMLGEAGLDEAMLAALAGQEEEPGGPEGGRPHPPALRTS
jgi:transposase